MSNHSLAASRSIVGISLRRARDLVFAAFAAAVLAACGGGADGGGGGATGAGPDTGPDPAPTTGSGLGALDPAAPLSTLDAAGLTAICNAFLQGPTSALSKPDAMRWTCYQEAITLHDEDPDSVPDCEAAAAACIGSPDADPIPDCQFDMADVAAAPACASGVTVADVQACIVETTAAIAGALPHLSCMTDIGPVLTPPTCAALQAKCPSLFGDSTDPGAKILR